MVERSEGDFRLQGVIAALLDLGDDWHLCLLEDGRLALVEQPDARVAKTSDGEGTLPDTS